MKIAYVYDSIYPWTKGGVEKRIYELSRRLIQREHEIHWFGLKWWEGKNNIKYEGIYLHGLGEWGELYTNGRRSIKEGLYFGWKTLTGLKGNFDIIDCQEFPYFPCFSAKFHSLLKRSRLVITWHEIWGSYWYKYLGKKGFWGWSVERLVSKLTYRNIAVSERTRKDLKDIGVKGVEVIPIGIDFGWIQKIRKYEEESDIIFAGRLIKEKNVDVLIKAVGLVKKENPYIRCVIIGDGPEKSKLERLTSELGVDNNIKFVGFLEDYRSVISYMKSSKVFVLPSTREGFGLIALEANACGLPVITVSHEMNAVCDYVADDNGFIYELSAEQIAEGITKALNSKGIAKGCIEFTKKYDWDRIVNLIEGFYKKII